MSKFLEVPVWGLTLNAAGTFIVGCIYLGSTAAFNAIINSCIMLQIVSFAFPCVLLVIQKRNDSVLPPERAFKVPGLVGWVANVIMIVFAMVEVIFFSFPTELPVSGSSMSKYYCYYQLLVISAGLVTLMEWPGKLLYRLRLRGLCCHSCPRRAELVSICEEALRWSRYLELGTWGNKYIS